MERNHVDLVDKAIKASFGKRTRGDFNYRTINVLGYGSVEFLTRKEGNLIVKPSLLNYFTTAFGFVSCRFYGELSEDGKQITVSEQYEKEGKRYVEKLRQLTGGEIAKLKIV